MCTGLFDGIVYLAGPADQNTPYNPHDSKTLRGSTVVVSKVRGRDPVKVPYDQLVEAEEMYEILTRLEQQEIDDFQKLVHSSYDSATGSVVLNMIQTALSKLTGGYGSVDIPHLGYTAPFCQHPHTPGWQPLHDYHRPPTRYPHGGYGAMSNRGTPYTPEQGYPRGFNPPSPHKQGDPNCKTDTESDYK